MTDHELRITPELKAQCIQEALDCRNAAAVARQHQLPPDRVRRWVRAATRQPVPPKTADVREVLAQTAAENRQLKELLGEKDLEIAILKDLVKKVDRVPPRGAKSPING